MRRVLSLLLVTTFWTLPLSGQAVIVVKHHASAAPTITFVQGCVNSASSTGTVTCPMGSSIISGNLLNVSSKVGLDAAQPTVTFSSSSGVSCTWVSAVAVTANTGTGGPFYDAMATCLVPSTGTETVQVAWTGSESFVDIRVAEYHTSTSWKSPALDQSTSHATTTAGTTCTTGTTPATSNTYDLVVANCDTWNAAQTWGAVSGWTNRATASRNTAGSYDKSVTSTGTQTFSDTSITSDISTGMIAAFMSN